MKQFQTKARPLLCGFILLSFFLPAYDHYSAFQFISLVLHQVDKAYDISRTDAFIAIGALLTIPFSALALLARWYWRRHTRRIYVAMPFIFFLFFTGILFTNLSGSTVATSFNAFANAGIGFYLTGLCSASLLATKNPKRKSRRRRTHADVQLSV